MYSSRMRTARLWTVSQHALDRAVSAQGVSATHIPGQTPPRWTEFLTHACENITLRNFVVGGNNYK